MNKFDKFYLATFIFSLIYVSPASCFYPEYTPLRFYNQYVINPAFIKADSILQFNLLGNSKWTSVNGHPEVYFVNAIGNIKKPQISPFIGYSYSTIGIQKENEIAVGCSWNNCLSESFTFLAGFDYHYNFIKADLSKLVPQFSSAIERRSENTWNIGTGFKFKNLTFGIKNQSFFFTHENHYFYSQTMSANYRINGPFDFSITPYLDYNYMHDFDNLSTFGLDLEYNKKVGLGFYKTSSEFSSFAFVGTVCLLKRVKLFFQLTNDGSLSSSKFQWIHDSISGWTLLGEMRVNI